MNNIYKNNSLIIGNTPLIRLNKIGKGNIIAKIESKNPGFSVKCRIALNMILEAEKKGEINKKTEIIEATSGNTGISLAYICAAKNYKITLTMPETMSMERKKLLKALGANLILTNGKKGMKGAIYKANMLFKNNPRKYILLKQFENPANTIIHEQTTGPEIWNDTNGKIDVLICGVGTGGTITGISQYFKYVKKKKNFITIAVEPENSAVITQKFKNIPISIQPHKIQGIGAGFIPKNLNLNIIDKVIKVSDIEAMQNARDVMKKEGILVGISSGAVIAAALKLQKKKLFKNKKILVIFPSSGERYLTTDLFSKYKC